MKKTGVLLDLKMISDHELELLMKKMKIKKRILPSSFSKPKIILDELPQKNNEIIKPKKRLRRE